MSPAAQQAFTPRGFLSPKLFCTPCKTLHTLCIPSALPSRTRSEPIGPASVAGAAEVEDPPKNLSSAQLGREEGASQRLQGCLRSNERLFLLAWQDAAAPPDTLLTQFTLWKRSSGAERGVALRVNPARASAAGLSAAVHAGETSYPPNLNETGWCQSQPSCGQGRSCLTGYPASATFLRSADTTFKTDTMPAGRASLCICAGSQQALGMSHAAAIYLQGNGLDDEKFYIIH